MNRTLSKKVGKRRTFLEVGVFNKGFVFLGEQLARRDDTLVMKSFHLNPRLVEQLSHRLILFPLGIRHLVISQHNHGVQ